MSRRSFYKDEDFDLSLEELNEQPFVHVTFNRFNKHVYKKLLEQWKEVLMRFYYLGYVQVFTYTKDPRIIKLVGGADKIGEHMGYEVYKWDLN